MLQSHNTQVETIPTGDDWRWEAVAARDAAADGQFVYGVISTRIFCRPSCPSRRPRRDRVRFFASAGAAETAGFRACRRCQPDTAPRSNASAVQRAADYLTAHAVETVSLATLAKAAGVSAFHLQRQFKKALGVSPREFHAARRAERFRRELRSGHDVTSATYEAGYGSPSRVYEAPPTGPGMAPAEYRRGGAGRDIGFVTLRCELGWLLVAATAKRLCAVKLGDSAGSLESDLRQEFVNAQVEPDRFVRRSWVRAIVSQIAGTSGGTRLPLDVRGTAFQWRVWRALQAIPTGQTRSYSDVARAIGRPAAVRAVARACASNPVCLVVPCHRVVGKRDAGGYRWGVERTSRLLKSEKKAK